MEENSNELAVSASEVTILSDRHNMAVMLDKNIKSHALIAQQSLYEVCKGLKEMRDGKLYKELGYQNFEDYCENEVGIKRRQAYNYISVAEKLSENFVHSGAQIGIKKLALLAKLDESDREQIRQETDMESVTVKELQEKIRELKEGRKKLVHSLGESCRKRTELIKENELLASVVSANRHETEKVKAKFETHIAELEKQIQELEDRPVEVMQSTAELEEIKRLKSELQETKEREQEAKAETERMQNASAKAVAESKKQIEEMQARISEFEKQPVSGAESDAKELFRPYFQACTHSIGLMMDFISKQKESSDFAFLTSKASQIAEVIESQLQALKNQSE
ncbi:MAG: hypothetical protein K2H89_08955 [Oscillospiraceae bacterium]|nr:hypothetical protein [Oscillospiraceae bacterium]